MGMGVSNNVSSKDFKAPSSFEKKPSTNVLIKHLRTISKTKVVSAFILGGLAGAAVGGGIGTAFTGATLGLGFKAIFIGAGVGFIIGGISAVGAMVVKKAFNALGEALASGRSKSMNRFGSHFAPKNASPLENVKTNRERDENPWDDGYLSD